MRRAPVKTWLIILLCLTTVNTLAQKKRNKIDHTNKVDPFIGTAGNGNTNPGAATPFGMIQLSPVSGNRANGYSYTDSTILGFTAATYFGSNGESQNEILFSATTGKPDYSVKGRLSTYKKKNEKAEPGAYSVELDRFNIDAEATVTPRTGLLNLDFPKADNANIILDLTYGAPATESYYEVVGPTEIKGYRKCVVDGHARNTFFYLRFSKPYQNIYSINRDSVKINAAAASSQGTRQMVCFNFTDVNKLQVTISLSHTGMEGALINLKAEQKEADFKNIAKATKALWADELARVDIEGGAPALPQAITNQPQVMYGAYGMPMGNDTRVKLPDPAALKQKTFYTALYHCMLSPTLASDADGNYINSEGEKGTEKNTPYYDVSSLCQFGVKYQLFNLVTPAYSSAFINSYLRDGSHPYNLGFIQMLLDADTKNSQLANINKAYRGVKNTLDSYTYFNTYGIAEGDSLAQLAQTLKLSYYNWCAAKMAHHLKKDEDYIVFLKRSQNWKNLYNAKDQLLEYRKNGGWPQLYQQADTTAGYRVGNGWQYAFFVPHDVETLANLMGGKDVFETKLDDYFNASVQIPYYVKTVGQFNVAYTFNYYLPYLYNFTVSPQKGQVAINIAARRLFGSAPDALNADDYNGQVSAWYIMNSIGLYSLVPGDEYTIGFPQFDKVEISLPNNKLLTILNGGASITRGNIYIQGINLNKSGYTKSYLNYADVLKGCELEVFTGTMANQLFMQDLHKPVSRITDYPIIPLPAIELNISKQKIMATLSCADSTAAIYYTTNGTTPTTASAKYSVPFTVATGQTVKAIAVLKENSSQIAVANTSK